jgi:tRNA nucleotidyltransferase (CCA-adding enzyme)
VYALLSPFPNEILLFFMARTNQEAARKAISLYFTQLKGIKLFVGGEDLKSLGLTPGPLFKTILNDLLEARINEKVLTRNDEIAYVTERYLKPATLGAP